MVRFRNINKIRAWRTGALAAAVLFVFPLTLPGLHTIRAEAATQQDEISASKQKISDNKKKIEEIQSQKYQVESKLKELRELKADGRTVDAIPVFDGGVHRIEVEMG